MEIVEKKIEDLIPYINNPRNNEQAIDAVASSIKNFGFKVPIILDKNNEIITGHTRLKAAKKLGYKKVPCIIADDLTEAQIKAFRLADNKVAELSTWDIDMLNVELEELSLEELVFDMEGFGFENIVQLEEINKDDIEENLYERELEPYDKIHYLITINNKDINRIEEFIQNLKGEIHDVEIEQSQYRNR